jgi:hypothetical protein
MVYRAMKASLTNESAGAFFDARAEAEAVKLVKPVAPNGLTMAPWTEALPKWRAALTQLPGATFYHCERWLEVLRSSYSINLQVATLYRGGDLRAAGVLARSKRLSATRFVSLPFSDCGQPLAVDDEARHDFMRALASANPRASIEIRGAAGPDPWKNIDCFAHWTLAMQRPFTEIQAGFGRTVRGGAKRARKDNVQIDRGHSIEYVARFFKLQLETRRRLGIPPQPFKFFATIHEKFACGGDCEVWFATLDGRDLAGLVLLRDGDRLCYKWGARLEDSHQGANHLLVASMIEESAGKARSLDFGRCDVRNPGLVRSKVDLGCVAHALPYAFYPNAPRAISSEVLSGPAKILSGVWKRLPLPLTRVLGAALYRYIV